MEETAARSVATTPSPVPASVACTAISAAQTTSTSSTSGSAAVAADAAAVFASPPKSSAPVRILGRNVNGTVVQTSMPQNEAELQLYRVMQRASLLTYYDTLLEMGGDDVQQLCDAGEEEFLEIMALVGMASKPLHVRRLQKALQEWLTNPAMFQTPVLAPPSTNSSTATTSGAKPSTTPVVFPCIGSYSPNTRQQQQVQSSAGPAMAAVSSIASQSAAKLLTASSSLGLPVAPAAATPPSMACHSGGSPLVQSAAGGNQLLSQFSAASGCCPIQRRKSLSPPATSSSLALAGLQMQQAMPSAAESVIATGLPLSRSPGMMQVTNYESSSCGSQGTTPSPGSNSVMPNAPQSPTLCLQQATPILLESQVQRLAEAAERLAATLRPPNPKPQSGIKKKMCKHLEMVMAMPDSDPRRMEEIRKYAAIYGRFDCKRKPEKPLTLHEVSVNEAAAQICRFVPALLTRRDELFPLARRVVRDSGHYYTKSLLHSSIMSSRENGDGDLSGGDDSSLLTAPTSGDSAKRRKLELRCEDDSVAGNREHPAESAQQQAETAQINRTGYSRGPIATDSDSNSIQVHQNRHRKRQRRRRPSKIGHKSISSPVWQTCTDGNSILLDGVVDGLEDSDGCYSSFDDDWDDCNDDCEDNMGIDSDDAVRVYNDQDVSGSAPLTHDVQNRGAAEDDDVSCMMDKENDFNLKVIASCGDNIIAVANPALMNRNQPTPMTKEQPAIKEEITLRDRRD
ncbi:NGFI-A-binding protein homolog isoform X2 [Nasonia vitripennis]|uniref:NGFI-A-binding protein homolog n=1 Tax=Nasonia vitripennis TaxID=7425 RepID=A0A7M7T9D3_NASVI|nr:NGFI-A-binding protein homolog isoform X2 [Nasonia vitripennis]